MAHFARLNADDIVEEVIVVNNNELLDENGIEQEQNGIMFCQELFGGRWIQTSYNGSIRGNFATIGSRYWHVEDVFIPPKRYESFVLNKDFKWVPPVDYPTDGKVYYWDESIINWVEVS